MLLVRSLQRSRSLQPLTSDKFCSLSLTGQLNLTASPEARIEFFKATGWRAFASDSVIPASLVDQILGFVRKEKTNPQCRDILDTGLRTIGQEHKKQRSRLLLGLGGLETDQSKWGQASQHASEAFSLVNGEPDCVDAQLEACSQHTCASLASSSPLPALQGAGGMFDVFPGVQFLANGDFAQVNEVLLGNRVSALNDMTRDTASAAISLRTYDHGLCLLAKGNHKAASEAFQGSSADAHKLSCVDDHTLLRTLLPPMEAAELHAASIAASAQASLAAGKQNVAEDLLAQALTATEQVSGEKHVRVAPVLLLLANLYARTRRITLAEGLYRNAAKLLHLNPVQNSESASSQCFGAHPSIGALLSWRYSQLLTALPKRESEARAWHQAAVSLCSSGSWLDTLSTGSKWHGLSLEEVFGGLGQMQGGQEFGRSFVVDLRTRRAYIGQYADQVQFELKSATL